MFGNQQNLSGLFGDNCADVGTQQAIDPMKLRDGLAAFRAEWEEATGGDLESVTLNLRLFFLDLDNILMQSK